MKKQMLSLVKPCNFRCPYTEQVLDRDCSVSSCNFNLPKNPKSETHHRCFLRYVEYIKQNPIQLDREAEADYGSLPLDRRTKIVADFFNVEANDIERVCSDFYLSLFNVIAEDTILSVRKKQLEPVPYRQCAVCGEEAELYCPTSLPPGFGYCSYRCFQIKPPPILRLERNLELDFIELIKCLEYETAQHRPRFVRQVITWVLGNTSMI